MSRIHFSLCCSALVLAASLAACGDDDQAAGTPTDFFTSLRTSVCKFEVECGSMPDVATCEAVTVFGKEQVTAIAYVDAGKVVYDAGKAAECLDFVDSLSCTDSLFDLEAEFTAKCGVVLTGTVAAGNACTIPEECMAGATCQSSGSCDSSTMCCAGTCGAPAPTTEVALGGDCSQNTNCVAGAYCKTDTQGAVCTAQVADEGGACDAFDACKSPLVCNIGFTGAGTCYKPAANGATCDPNVFFGACAAITDYCDSTEMKCKTRGKPGDDCVADQSESCLDYAECVDAKCVARPVAGGDCTGDVQSNCLGDLVCGSDLKCALPPAETACP